MCKNTKKKNMIINNHPNLVGPSLEEKRFIPNTIGGLQLTALYFNQSLNHKKTYAL